MVTFLFDLTMINIHHSAIHVKNCKPYTENGEKVMTTAEFLDYMNSGKQVTAECGVHRTMHKLSQDAIRITMQINNCYHTPDEINELMSELVGEPVEVGLFPPFYTDCGKNIHLGKGVSTQNCEDRYSVVISVSQLTISTLFSNKHSSLFCFVSFCFLILLYIGLTPFNFGQQKILPPKTSEEGSVINIQFFQAAELSCLTVIRV